MNPDRFFKGNARIVAVPNDKVIYLDAKNAEDLEFVRAAYGFEAEEKGWFRERDRPMKSSTMRRRPELRNSSVWLYVGIAKSRFRFRQLKHWEV